MAAALQKKETIAQLMFFAQDAGALGALEKAGRSSKLPEQLLNKVDARYRSSDGE